MFDFKYNHKDFIEFCKGDQSKYHPVYFGKCQKSLLDQRVEVFWSTVEKKYVVYDNGKTAIPEEQDLRKLIGKLYLHKLKK